MSKAKAPDTPSYAPKLNTWHDKQVQKENITRDQLVLQDQIAAEMGLQAGERRTVTHNHVAYEVVGVMRYEATGDKVSCEIKSTAIEEAI